MANEGFLNRWSRLKRDSGAPGTPEGDGSTGPGHESVAGSSRRESRAGQGEAPGEALSAGAGSGGEALPGTAADQPGRAGGLAGPALSSSRSDQEAHALPSLESLGFDSDYSPFMRGDVDPGLRMSALKKLFSDPHFNRMDGLDIYIGDYTQPDPIPRAMLARLNQSRLLGLFEEEKEAGEKQENERQNKRENGPQAENGAKGEERGREDTAGRDGRPGETADADPPADLAAAPDGDAAAADAAPAASATQADRKVDDPLPPGAAVDGSADAPAAAGPAAIDRSGPMAKASGLGDSRPESNPKSPPDFRQHI